MIFCPKCKKEIDQLAVKCPHCKFDFPEEAMPKDKFRHTFVRHTIVAVFIYSVFCYHIFSLRHYIRSLGEIILTILLIPVYIPYVMLIGIPAPHGLVRFPNSIRGFLIVGFLVVLGMIGPYLYSIFLLSIDKIFSKYSVAASYYPPRSLIKFFILCFLVIFATSFIKFEAKYSDKSMYRISCSNNLKQIGLSLRMYANVYDGNLPPYDGARGLDILKSDGFLDNENIYLCPTVEFNNYDGKRVSGNEFLLTDYEYCGNLNESDPKDTPVAWDKSTNHIGCRNVLFLDGKVKEIKNAEWEGKIIPMVIRRQVKKR